MTITDYPPVEAEGTPITCTNSSGADCVFQCQADAVAAARELQALTKTPSLLELQPSFMRRYAASPTSRNSQFQGDAAGQAHPRNLSDMIAHVLDILDDDSLVEWS